MANYLTAMPSNPFFAYVDFKIGDYNVSRIPPNHILTFTYDRITLDAANTFQLSVIDETALALEFQLAQGSEDVVFSYGYNNGAKSKEFTSQVTNYKLTFATYGVQLDIEGISTGLSSYGEPKTDTYEDMLISDIVKKIANEEGWKIGKIEKTKKVFESDNKTQKKFTRNNQNAVNFIKQELTPYATSASTGAGDYKLYFDDSTDTPTVNYHPNDVSNKNSSDSSSTNSENNFFEVRFGSDNQSRVISFEPDFSGTLACAQGACDIDLSTVDALRNEMFQIKSNKDVNSLVPKTGSRDNITVTRYMNTMNSSSLSSSEATNLAATMWCKMVGTAYGATMTIIGDPTIEPQSMCTVLVVNRDGLPHHTTGAYLVTQVTDSIEGGTYTTTLKLFKNALNVGKNSAGGIDITLNTEYVPVPSIIGGTPGSGGGDDSTSTDSIVSSSEELRAIVDKYIGLPYISGGHGPKGYDCSGFVSQVYRDLGIMNDWKSTSDFIHWGTEVGWDKSKIQPGDFIVHRTNGEGHIVLIIDQNTIAHSPRPGKTITYQSIDYYWNYQNTYRNTSSVRRPPGITKLSNGGGVMPDSKSALSGVVVDLLPKGSNHGRPGTKRKQTTKIAWHYVGGPGASAKNVRDYFANGSEGRHCSSHYVVGLNGEVYYCVPEDEIAWTTNSANSYSIGIECCHPSSDGHYNTATYNAMVKLGKALAKKYRLNPQTDFIRHYDVTKKICPKWFVDHPDAWAKFKSDCKV